MATTNLNLLIVVSLPHSDHQCSSSSQAAPDATNDSQENQNMNLVSDGLKIQIPSSDGEFELSNGVGDPETPRSIDNRIPVIPSCPPAPRKARKVSVTGKRKAQCFPVVRVPTDFIVYVDAMLAMNETVYVPDIVVGDLGNIKDHAKKLKLLPAPEQNP